MPPPSPPHPPPGCPGPHGGIAFHKRRASSPPTPCSGNCQALLKAVSDEALRHPISTSKTPAKMINAPRTVTKTSDILGTTRQDPSPVSYLLPQTPVRFRHGGSARRVKAKDRGYPVHVHPAILLAVGAGVEGLARAPAKAADLGLPVNGAMDAHGHSPRIDHIGRLFAKTRCVKLRPGTKPGWYETVARQALLLAPNPAHRAVAGDWPAALCAQRWACYTPHR